MITPPKLVHYGSRSTDDREALVAACGKARHMSKGEIRLLAFYAQQSDFFQPSLRHIANTTGLNRSQVFRCREALIRDRVALEVYRDGKPQKLIIHWPNIRLFSTLDPKMTSKHDWAAPIEFNRSKRAGSSLSLLDFKTLPIEDLVMRIAAMPPDDYAAFCRKLKSAR